MHSEFRKLDLLDRQLYYSIKGQTDKSDELLKQLMIERPYELKVWYNYAFKLLREGKIKEGMVNLNKGRYINVFGSPLLNTDKKPISSLKNLKNLTILVNLEGGVGDNFLGLKFARELSYKNEIIAIGPKSLNKLIENQAYISQYFNEFNGSIKFDCWYPSLASELLLEYEDYNEIPTEPHIFVKEKPEIIKNSIGVKFRGNKDFDHNKYRSPAPKEIIKTLEPFKDKFNFYSLEAEDNLELPNWIKKSKLKNWYDTALLITKMEKVISTCTGVAHLSAGIGKETYIIVPILPYWIWAYPNIVGRDDRTWYYNNTYLLRQKVFNCWKNPLNKINKLLGGQ